MLPDKNVPRTHPWVWPKECDGAVKDRFRLLNGSLYLGKLLYVGTS
jgi:hypothetical protein